MVDYQGPELLRGIVQAMKIPYFDRITEVRGFYMTADAIPVTPEEVQRLAHLEKLTLAKTLGTVEAADLEAAHAVAPSCRHVATQSTDREIQIDLVPGHPLACSAN